MPFPLRIVQPCIHRLYRVANHPRHLSGIARYPAIHEFASSLAQSQPSFAISSEKVHILSNPADFYTRLTDLIRGAEKRIFISSLYIGSTETSLLETIQDTLRCKKFLHIYLQLDCNRSTRPGSSSTAALLAPLLKEFPDRCHVSLFRSPKLKGVFSNLIPPRFNEGFGTWHAKIYGADDTVMISGANLNKSYFTDRQDRYLLFPSAPELSNYCFDFLKTASSFSYKLLPSSTPDDIGARPIPHWPHSSIHPHHIESQAKVSLSSLQRNYNMKSGDIQEQLQRENSVVIFPVIQAGQFHIREEEECLRQLFYHLDPARSRDTTPDFQPLLNLTSGYFGLSKLYKNLILRSHVPTSIICASPEANGFYGSKGISSRLPEGYTWLEQRFMAAVRASQPQDSGSVPGSVELKEWNRQGWTYHAKGIWLSPNPESLPILTLFGSTNLNSRSAQLDTELSFVMLANSETVQEKLHLELQGLQNFAEDWKGDRRNVRAVTKLLVRLLSGYL
ncbi:CDP-diacylglycerol-glycerol-3-phosphate 3-phosphatidyltransferase [Russula decolorans]